VSSVGRLSGVGFYGMVDAYVNVEVAVWAIDNVHAFILVTL